MVQHLSFKTISLVYDSWELARKRYGDEKLGVDILLNLFDYDPEIKKIYGFQVEKDFRRDSILRMSLSAHGVHQMYKLESMISLLGPDDEELAEILAETAKRHAAYGVKKEMLHLMTNAVLKTLAAKFGDKWTGDLKNAWEEVAEFMVRAIYNAM